MILGQWWVANPAAAGDRYEAPDPAERVPGTLREVAPGEFVLETIGFLADRPFMAGGPAAASDRTPPEIWGTDRDATCYSLFDNLRVHSTWHSNHVSDGHEDWRVGSLAKGHAWVTSDDVCSTAWIRIDDLHGWALYPRRRKIVFDDAWETATIDLREETLCTTMIGDTGVSLVSRSYVTTDSAGQGHDQHSTLHDTVYWKVEGLVKLRAIAGEWIGHLESFSRFMTMRPSTVSRVNCRMVDLADPRHGVELIASRLERPSRAADRDDDRSSPHKYLTTLCTLETLGINAMDVLAGYWSEVATGEAYMAMVLHLESQDRLLSRGVDGAFLNAVRSVESLYAARHPGVAVESVSVQTTIDDAVTRTTDVGSQVLDAWPELSKTGVLRRDVAHGKGRPSASFGLRCLGGATALQWIQRVQLLTECGIADSAARSIVSGNAQYELDLGLLQEWSSELGRRPAS